MAKLISADLTNNKLCILEYTTTDGKMLSIKPDAFDAQIVSHTYTNIGNIVFQRSITTIGYCAFLNCSNLSSITIPDSVTTIGEEAFYKCTSLTSVTIPESVTTIGDSAFEDCKGLTSVTIGKSVSEIGKKAFKGCNIDTIVCCPKIPPEIYDSFGKFENLIVPTGCEEAYANSDWGQYLE